MPTGLANGFITLDTQVTWKSRSETTEKPVLTRAVNINLNFGDSFGGGKKIKYVFNAI